MKLPIATIAFVAVVQCGLFAVFDYSAPAMPSVSLLSIDRKLDAVYSQARINAIKLDSISNKADLSRQDALQRELNRQTRIKTVDARLDAITAILQGR